MSRDYYQDLNINRDATDEDIAKAYRKLSLKWHPKLSSDDAKTQKHYFSIISEAYEVLSEPVRKAFYDKYGEEKLKEGLFSQGELKGGYRFADNAEEIFNKFYEKNNAFAEIFDSKGEEELGSIFGSQFGGQGYKGNQRPSEKHVEVQVTLEEIYNGCSKDIDYTIIELKGDLRTTQKVTKTQRLDISKGIKSNSTITYKGQGNQAPYEKPSDLIFTIVEQKHPRFQRKNNDLIYTEKINLIEALNSNPVEIKTLDGRNIFVPMDTLVNPKTVKQVQGEGMPVQDECKKGELYIKFDIQFPNQINEEQKKRITELLN